MTVGELKELLDQYEDECKIFIMEQPSWPFENGIAGTVQRDEFDQEDDECRRPDDKTQATDVFILEGPQLRYGSKDAWEA